MRVVKTNKLERFIGTYDGAIKFIYKNNMPNGLGALTYGNNILINSNTSTKEQLENIAEEIGHIRTTEGNITDYSKEKNVKQEIQARRLGYTLIVDLDGLIACYKAGIRTPWEMADFFEVSESYIWKAIDTYKIKKGLCFTYKGYEFDVNNGFRMKELKYI